MSYGQQICRIFLLSAFFIPQLGFSTPINQPSYNTQVSLESKFGNKRNIYSANIIAPIFAQDDTLIFTNVIGMRDSKKCQEINIGLGMRCLYPEFIIGSHIYFDYRKTRFNTHVKQITFGTEFLLNDFEFRMNFYLPISRGSIIGESYTFKKEKINADTIFTSVANNIIATPLSGIDFEVGGNLHFSKKLSIFGGLYYFHSENVTTIKGGF